MGTQCHHLQQGSGAGFRHLFSSLFSLLHSSSYSLPHLTHTPAREGARWRTGRRRRQLRLRPQRLQGATWPLWPLHWKRLRTASQLCNATEEDKGQHCTLSHSQRRTPGGPLQRSAHGEPGNSACYRTSSPPVGSDPRGRVVTTAACQELGKEVRSAGRASPLTALQWRRNEASRAPRSWPARPHWERSTPAHALLKQLEQASMGATPPVASHNTPHSPLPLLAHSAPPPHTATNRRWTPRNTRPTAPTLLFHLRVTTTPLHFRFTG